MMSTAVEYAPVRRPVPRRSASVRAGLRALGEALLCNRDIYRSALASTEFATSADRVITLRQLEQERIETENAIDLLKAHEAQA